MCRLEDSLSRAAVTVEAARLFDAADDVEISLIVFDTSVPADSTGRPPVKAVMKQTARHRESRRDTASRISEVDARVSTEMTDRSLEESSTAEVAKESGWRSVRKYLIGAAVAIALALIALGIYKLVKTFKK